MDLEVIKEMMLGALPNRIEGHDKEGRLRLEVDVSDHSVKVGKVGVIGGLHIEVLHVESPII